MSSECPRVHGDRLGGLIRSSPRMSRECGVVAHLDVFHLLEEHERDPVVETSRPDGPRHLVANRRRRCPSKVDEPPLVPGTARCRRASSSTADELILRVLALEVVHLLTMSFMCWSVANPPRARSKPPPAPARFLLVPDELRHIGKHLGISHLREAVGRSQLIARRVTREGRAPPPSSSHGESTSCRAV